MSKGEGKWQNIKYVVLVFIATFVIASVMYLFSQLVLSNIESIIIGFALLLVVIFIGILFDIVGTGIAVADAATFRAKASRKLPGAKKSLMLIDNADKVANICNDVIGDICGTVSGGISAALVFVLVSDGGLLELIVSVVLTALTAALTVGGKAMGKNFALRKADSIIWVVGRILDLKAVFAHMKKNNDK